MLDPVFAECERRAEAHHAEAERDQQVLGAVAETVGKRDPQEDQIERRAAFAELHQRPGDHRSIGQRTERATQRRGRLVAQHRSDDGEAPDQVEEINQPVVEILRDEVKTEQQRVQDAHESLLVLAIRSRFQPCAQALDGAAAEPQCGRYGSRHSCWTCSTCFFMPLNASTTIPQ